MKTKKDEQKKVSPVLMKRLATSQEDAGSRGIDILLKNKHDSLESGAIICHKGIEYYCSIVVERVTPRQANNRRKAWGKKPRK